MMCYNKIYSTVDCKRKNKDPATYDETNYSH